MSKGLSSVKTLTAKEIANKWNLPLVVVSKKIAAGVKVEKEHTKSTRQANEIARDHLGERPDYYDKLGQMEKKKVKIKENTSVTGVAGLGFNTGVPAIDDDNEYITTNALARDSMNGAIMDFVNKHHQHLHSKTDFKHYDPKKIKMSSNKDLAESLGSDYGTAAVPIVGDLTGSSRKVMKVDETNKINLEKKKNIIQMMGNIGSDKPVSRTKAIRAGRAALKKPVFFDPPKKEQISEINIKKITDKIPPKAKKIGRGAMVAANLATLGQVAGDAAEGRKDVDPKRSMLGAVSTLSGPVGYGAMAANYSVKGFDKAREHLKLKEDLRKWFREKWVRYDTKGNIKGPCAREEGEGKPKCRPLASARAMSKDERAKSARRKRREDPVADRPGKGGKPVMVRTEETLMEKNVPTNPALWARAKAQARAKFDVYPSAYANGWASKWYKSKGGGWKTAANESIEEACWDTHKQVGMKKKGKRMVPDCVLKDEKSIVPANSTERGIYEISAELVGKVSNARFWQGKAPSKTLTRAINKKFIESGKPIPKKDKKESAKESWTPFFPPHHKHSARLSKEKSNKPDIIMDPGAGGTTKTIYEADYSKELGDPRFINTVSRESNFRDPKSLDAVLHVMHNRMGHKGYASSPLGVVSQRGQFAAYGRGAAKGLTDADRENILNRAKSIFSGSEKDITGGANEFRTTSKRNKPGGEVIGGNTYYRRGEFAKANPATTQPAKTPEEPKFVQPTKTPEAPKASDPPKQTQVNPGDEASSFVRKQLKIQEETTMDTTDIINEALDDILENNLVSMKENFMIALQEKAIEKLEERKKIIASEYFAQ